MGDAVLHHHHSNVIKGNANNPLGRLFFGRGTGQMVSGVSASAVGL
jgi:hypothetical protein